MLLRSRQPYAPLLVVTLLAADATCGAEPPTDQPQQKRLEINLDVAPPPGPYHIEVRVVPQTPPTTASASVHQAARVPLPPDVVRFTEDGQARRSPFDAYDSYEAPVRVPIEGTGSLPAPKRNYACDFVFELPAHVPIPEYGPRCPECDGLRPFAPRRFARIAEGMTLSADLDGTYELRYLIEIPNIPVAFRMQLDIQDNGLPLTRKPGCTISLRPARLRPTDADGRHTQFWFVRQTGWSPGLGRLLNLPHVARELGPENRDTALGNPAPPLTITRNGWCTFGSGIEADSPLSAR